MNRYDTLAATALLWGTLAIAGCGESSSSASVELQQGGGHAVDGSRYRLDQEPDDVLCVLDVREQISAGGEVAVLGRVGGMKNPFTNGEASFVITDPSVAVAGDDHECGDNCPYCAKKKKDQISSMAFVRIVDENGQVVPADVRQLLGVEQDQMVVVRGQAKVNRAGHLVISASGVHVRQ